MRKGCGDGSEIVFEGPWCEICCPTALALLAFCSFACSLALFLLKFYVLYGVFGVTQFWGLRRESSGLNLCENHVFTVSAGLRRDASGLNVCENNVFYGVFGLRREASGLDMSEGQPLQDSGPPPPGGCCWGLPPVSSLPSLLPAPAGARLA